MAQRADQSGDRVGGDGAVAAPVGDEDGAVEIALAARVAHRSQADAFEPAGSHGPVPFTVFDDRPAGREDPVGDTLGIVLCAVQMGQLHDRLPGCGWNSSARPWR